MNGPQRISICGGRLIDPANGIDAHLDLHLADGQILAIGAPPAGFTPDQVLDAQGCVVSPGLVDLAVRLREPGAEHKGTIASETAAAVAGGITSLCCFPDTQPVIDTPAVVELIRQRSERAGKARVLPVGALTRNLDGEHLSEMAALRQAGCLAVSNADQPLKSTLVQRRALEYASTFDLICIFQPTDQALRDHGCVHEGLVSTRLGLPGIPVAAETLALARDLALAAQTGARVHFRGLSSAGGARLLLQGRLDQARISADVSAHQLHLTEQDVSGFDSHCHVIPPLRTAADRDALRQAVATGLIDAITSDHQPQDPDAKANPFPSTAPGISGLETLLPLTLRLVDEGVMNLATALERITWGPARVLGLPLGRLDPGGSADVCVFDPNRTWTLEAGRMRSLGRNSPFLGQTLKGQVRHTLVGGRLVFTQES